MVKSPCCGINGWCHTIWKRIRIFFRYVVVYWCVVQYFFVHLYSYNFEFYFGMEARWVNLKVQTALISAYWLQKPLGTRMVRHGTWKTPLVHGLYYISVMVNWFFFLNLTCTFFVTVVNHSVLSHVVHFVLFLIS